MTHLLLGDIAPDFEQESSLGVIRLHQYLGSSWGVISSHPADFTPVCTTEMGSLTRLKTEFDKRDVKILGLSVDSVESHKKWILDINDVEKCNFTYPIIADTDRKVSKLYGMLHTDEQVISTARDNVNNRSLLLTVRTLFIIDPSKKIRLIMVYPMAVGRNFSELVRVIDALQLADARTVVTPADWSLGDDVIVPLSIGNDEKLIEDKYGNNVRTIRPYLRYIPSTTK